MQQLQSPVLVRLPLLCNSKLVPLVSGELDEMVQDHRSKFKPHISGVILEVLRFRGRSVGRVDRVGR